MNDSWLYEHVQRVPPISDEQIAKMRRIEPVVKVPESCMYRRIKGADKIHPQTESCIWNTEPHGPEFTFDTLNKTTIVTQHHSAIFFKPSLAEVYAWILVYMPKTWSLVRFFCLGDSKRIGGSTDVVCECEIMGGDMLVAGSPVMFATGAVGHELVKKEV